MGPAEYRSKTTEIDSASVRLTEATYLSSISPKDNPFSIEFCESETHHIKLSYKTAII